jgi:hypothetical protein
MLYYYQYAKQELFDWVKVKLGKGLKKSVFTCFYIGETARKFPCE